MVPRPLEEKATLPAWVDGLLVQGLSALLILLAPREWLAFAAGALAAAIRLYFAAAFERRRFFVALSLGLLLEVAFWRAGAIAYLSPAVAWVPLWILPLWGWAGLLTAQFAAPSPERQTLLDPSARAVLAKNLLALLPLSLVWLAPDRWEVCLAAAALALLIAARRFPEKTFPTRRVLGAALVMIGGTSASFSFALAETYYCPQAWHSIPSWGFGMWAALVVAVIRIAG
jgi:hypothetical protein